MKKVKLCKVYRLNVHKGMRFASGIILYTISLAISYVLHLYVLIFVQYRTISIAMTRTGSYANETTNLQTPSFKGDQKCI